MTVLRPPSGQRIISGGALAITGAAVIAGGLADGGRVLLLAVLCGLGALAAAWRTDRMRVELGAQVVVVNFLRRHVVPWDEVARFDYEAGAVLLGSDDRRTRISAFTPPSGALRGVERRCRQAVATMEGVRRGRSR